MRILLIEDDAVLGDGLSRSLTDWGFIVTLAENGDYAEAALLTQPYDLLILDLGLPDMAEKYYDNYVHGNRQCQY